jgi:hypothetical protein
MTCGGGGVKIDRRATIDEFACMLPHRELDTIDG